MSNIYEQSLKLHEEKKGKIEILSKIEINSKEDLSLAYSPGVAEPCRKIAEDKNNSYKYTSKGNIVAVISDGSAVLGLGNIGPDAAMPVMEGKSILFKRFAGIDSFPIVLDTQDTEEIIKTIKFIAPSFGGINLEDISAPRCVEIEKRLIEELDIPVFHDDQHGTAIVTCAGLINSAKLLKKNLSDLKVVVNGAGSAGSSISKMILSLGVKELLVLDKDGILNKDDSENYNFLQKELAQISNPNNLKGVLKDAIVGADVFIGVSVGNILTKDMVRTMNKDAIIFAMANPTPEIMPEDALEAGAAIIGTGRSDYPNQINNVLVFPGLFKGALRSRAKKITEEMKMAAAMGLANLLDEKELRKDYIIPDVFDCRVAEAVAREVEKLVI